MGVFRLNSIRLQILALGLVPLLMLVAITVTVSFLHNWAATTTRDSLHANAVLKYVKAVVSSETLVEAYAGDFVTMANPRAGIHVAPEQSQLRAALEKLRSVTRSDPRERSLFSTMSAGILERLQVLDRGVALAKQGDHRSALAALASHSSGQAFLRFNAAANSFETYERNRQDHDGRLFLHRITVAYQAIVAGSAIACLITIGVMLTLALRVSRRLGAVTERATHYADNRELLPAIGGSDEIAEIDGAFSNLVDVVQRRESLLQRYRLLAETAEDAIIFVDDSDDHIVEVNSSAARMFGYRRQEMLDMPASRIRGPHPIFHGEGTGVRKDGTSFPIDVRTALSASPEGSMHLAIIRDITERKESENAVRRALAQAVDASRLKSEFVSTMSHEIRTPMNAVIGMSELLLETSLSSEQEEYVRVLRASGQSLLSVINDILDFSKIEAGRMELGYEEFALITVVEDTAAIVAEAARKKHLELMTYVDPRIPSILIGDGDRLRQVLVNLVNNAVKFTERGSVVVSAELLELRGDEAEIAFDVRDTGIGMSAEQMTKLFQAFRQADGSTTRRFGGTGLGLVISQRLVQAMGGKIAVESHEAEGSRFFFRLCLQRGTGHAAVEARDVLAGMRVLVIDDDAAARNILDRYLTSWRVEHRCVADRAEALAALRDADARGKPFTAALVDLRLGDDNGFDLAEAVRAEPIAQPALVMITAYDAIDQGSRAVGGGFLAYLLKPIRQSQLYDVLIRIASGEPFSLSPPRPTEESMRSQSASPARILVAEDNEVNQRLAVRQLQIIGYEDVTVVADGAEALEALRARHYDLVLMDLHMPNLDGFQTARAIRRMEAAGERIPIVAMTADALAQDRDESLAAGMDDHIGKPVSLAVLRETLARWLPEGATREATPVIDHVRLRELFDDRNEVRNVLLLARKTLGESMERLRDASNSEIVQVAHNVKGAAANVGAIELSESAAELERVAKEGGATRDAASRLRQAYRRFSETVENLGDAV